MHQHGPLLSACSLGSRWTCVSTPRVQGSGCGHCGCSALPHCGAGILPAAGAPSPRAGGQLSQAPQLWRRLTGTSLRLNPTPKGSSLPLLPPPTFIRCMPESRRLQGTAAATAAWQLPTPLGPEPMLRGGSVLAPSAGGVEGVHHHLIPRLRTRPHLPGHPPPCTRLQQRHAAGRGQMHPACSLQPGACGALQGPQRLPTAQPGTLSVPCSGSSLLPSISKRGSRCPPVRGLQPGASPSLPPGQMAWLLGATSVGWQ